MRNKYIKFHSLKLIPSYFCFTLTGVNFNTSTWVKARSFLWYPLNLFFKGKSASITNYTLYPLSSPNLSKYARVELLCIEYILPLQICIAIYKNLLSIFSYLVPKGGFMTTKSTFFGLSFNLETSARMSSKWPPSTFCSSCFCPT